MPHTDMGLISLNSTDGVDSANCLNVELLFNLSDGMMTYLDS